MGVRIKKVEWRVNGVTVGVNVPTTSISSMPVRLKRDLVVDEGDNVIEVVAYNAADLIASVPARATVSAPASVTSLQARMIVLAIGLDKYEDASLDLTYAVSDAEALAQALRVAGEASGRMLTSRY